MPDAERADAGPRYEVTVGAATTSAADSGAAGASIANAEMEVEAEAEVSPLLQAAEERRTAEGLTPAKENLKVLSCLSC